MWQPWPRGFETTAEYFSKGFALAVYVSDCWSAQLKTSAKKHQLCLAHLIRELANFEEALICKWCVGLKAHLKQAIVRKNEFQEIDYLHPPSSVIEIEFELDQMLAVDYTNFHPKTKAFIKRLLKNRNSIFTFLYYQEVPYDNNGSERAIRNVKIKKKYQGLFEVKMEPNDSQFFVQLLIKQSETVKMYSLHLIYWLD